MNRPPAPMIPTYTLPGVLTMLGPTGPARPLLLDSPHSGIDYPPDFDAAVDRDTLLDAVDTAVDDLFGAGPELGAALLKAHFPRTYIDPNRAVDDLDARILDGCWPGPLSPTEKTRRGNGLIRRTIGDDDRALYSRRLGVAEVQERIRRYHAPYHRALGEAQDRLMERFGAVYHLNCHSMGSRSREDMTRRPDIVLGDRDGTTCEAEFTALAAEVMGGLGYRVRTNHIFKGVELIRAFSAPDAGRHCLQIEVNKDLYIDEATRHPSPDFASVQADLAKLIDRLAAYAEERANGAGRDVA